MAGRCIRTLADEVDQQLQRKKFMIKGRACKAMAETHPTRRRACAKFYKVCDMFTIMHVEAKDFELFTRGLALYRLPTSDLAVRVAIDDAGNHKTLEQIRLDLNYDEKIVELASVSPPRGCRSRPRNAPNDASQVG